MDSPIRAFRQAFLYDLLCPFRSHGERHHLASMLFLQAQSFLERKAVGLVHLESDVGLAYPCAAFRYVQRSILGRNLLDANGDFHLFLDWALAPEWHEGQKSFQVLPRRSRACLRLDFRLVPALEQERGI